MNLEKYQQFYFGSNNISFVSPATTTLQSTRSINTIMHAFHPQIPKPNGYYNFHRISDNSSTNSRCPKIRIVTITATIPRDLNPRIQDDTITTSKVTTTTAAITIGILIRIIDPCNGKFMILSINTSASSRARVLGFRNKAWVRSQISVFSSRRCQQITS